jgi:predicted O-methyltransferase YrrM
MNISAFCSKFDKSFPPEEREKTTRIFEYRFLRRFFDPCRSINGMSSIKKLRLLNLAYSFLEIDECYVEIGTFSGKSLISAMIKNNLRKTYACDNFSEFSDLSSESTLKSNLEQYNLKDKVVFFNSDFRRILNHQNIKMPIGLYFYDAAHDYESHYSAVKLVENVLANEALIIVDDWRFDRDSQSYAKSGTLKAIEESKHVYNLLYELPARHNGDHAMWWNGIAVYAFYKDNNIQFICS